MNELRGRYINVILGIEEGKGMDFLKQPVQVVAHFNGRVMESDSVEPNESINFATELVWETDKKDIRKVRSANLPLRIECVSMNERGNRECIGYTLLSMRCAQAIPTNNQNMEVQWKWYKLLGVPSVYKKSHPQLQLSLTLRDQIIRSNVFPALGNYSNIEVEGAKTIIPIHKAENGYIQIGDTTENMKRFQMTTTVKSVSNLDLLLPKTLVFNPSKDDFYLSFLIFGSTVNTKMFNRNLYETLQLDEDIIINLLANFDILKLFLQKFTEVLVYFCHGKLQLGYANINIEKLFQNIEEINFNDECKLVTKEMGIFNEMSSSNNVQVKICDRQPRIDIEFSICGGPITQKDMFKSRIDKSYDTKASGDKISESLYKHEIKTSCRVYVPELSDTLEYPMEIDHIRTFTLDLILESLIWKTNLQGNMYNFRFKHPKASAYVIIKTEIENIIDRNILLESLHCRFTYVTTAACVRNLVSLWSPKVVMEDIDGSPISEEIIFTPENLFNGGVSRECSYWKSVKQYSANKYLCEIKTWMYLQVLLEHPHVPNYNYELLPKILDENLIFKEIAELEKWKVDVRNEFETNLKNKEDKIIKELAERWREKKCELEKDLIKYTNKSKKVVQHYRRAINALHIENALEEKKKNQTVDDIHDEIRKNAIKYSLCENYEVIEKISKLEEDNKHLKEMLADQIQEINDIKKHALSNEQTANLLQEVRSLEEKLLETKKDKMYFKEQYSNAVKEIHELKTEGHKDIQHQIQINKEKISQLSLEKFTDTETCPLTEELSDSDVLDQGDNSDDDTKL